MLRSAGIPARIVTGFAGGELNEYGGYVIVRQSNAHSWVEAKIDGQWKRFDPTPPVAAEHPSSIALYIDLLRMKWDRYVISFSRYDQVEIVKAFTFPFSLPLMPEFKIKGFSGMIYVLLPLALLISAALILKNLRFKKYGYVTAGYLKLKNTLKSKGANITPSTTPSEAKQEAIQLGMDGKIGEFIQIYEEHRFGGREMKGEDRARYRKLLKEIKRII
jgi:hypothetical protein